MPMVKMIWLVLLIAFIWVEAETVAMVSLWFAIGSLAALIVESAGGGLGVQFLVFVAVSAGLLLLLRPITRKYFTPKLTKTNLDAVIGSTGLVTKAINNDLSQGQVKLGAMEWSARSTTGEELSEGTKIRVDKIEGVKVFVSPCPVEAVRK